MIQSGVGIALDIDTRGFRDGSRAVTGRFLKAAREAMKATATDLDRALTRAAEGAGLGRLGKAFKAVTYPKTGLAYSPSADIFVNGGERSRGAIAAYTEGGRISGRRGQYLAIPTKEAGKKNFRTPGPKGTRGSMPLTPKEWERRTGLKLRFVKRRGKNALLVLDNAKVSKAGRATASRSKQFGPGARGTQTVVIFILVPFVTTSRRFSVDAIAASYPGRLRATFLAKLAALPQV